MFQDTGEVVLENELVEVVLMSDGVLFCWFFFYFSARTGPFLMISSKN